MGQIGAGGGSGFVPFSPSVQPMRHTAISLPGITICAADSEQPSLAGRALAASVSHCDFAEAILFTDVPVEGPFRTVHIDRLASREDYSRFILKELPGYITTPFALVVQWDG